MRTDRQTDMTKLIVAFRNFAKASKKESRSLRKVSFIIARVSNQTPTNFSNMSLNQT
jgi:hypothetical protein